jgi:ferric-dicitrate binding protein FerR (iron transport regulator)
VTDLARLAAQVLSKGSDETSVTPPIDAQTLALVARAIRARKRARRLRWIAGGLVAAVAAALAVGISMRGGNVMPVAQGQASSSTGNAQVSDVTVSSVESMTGSAELATGGVRRSVTRGSTIAAGDELSLLPGAELAFTLPTGTRITMEEAGDLHVLDQGRSQIFQLSSGAMSAQVHKLASGERFVVRTLDAEIEVRGTSFRVAMAAPDDPCRAVSATHVDVFEGVVSVRPNGADEVRVGAGGTWPTECGSSGQPSGAAVPAPSSATPSLKSQLAEQNDLYGRAVTLREGGDRDRALVLFERLVKKFPAGPLAENATVERMKLLASAHASEAAQAAADYLAKYPAGFGRKEAEAILARDRNPR